MLIGAVLQCNSEPSALTLHGIVCILAVLVGVCVCESRHGKQGSVMPAVALCHFSEETDVEATCVH